MYCIEQPLPSCERLDLRRSGGRFAPRSGEERSEIFRADQRKEQVDEEDQRDDSNNDVFHRSDPIEGIRIANAQAEEADDYQHENEVHHEPTLPGLELVGWALARLHDLRDSSHAWHFPHHVAKAG
jgi:hypothetical protein